ncbi:hypothetical protein CPTAbTP3Phi1_049 [Acinetobacter phage AbTP3phi1]|uniref:Uncharacterized protein n=1 Tax=Acinetobacter phage AbTP3phi1 TaxID=2920932 RepID=A0AC61TTF4_9CAUD|nr:hypothetical protein CPTAbTP3Phi1_049 [Acinetobacter phage AbTP3phi1]
MDFVNMILEWLKAHVGVIFMGGGGWCNSHRLSAFWQAISYRVRHIASNYTYSTTTY